MVIYTEKGHVHMCACIYVYIYNTYLIRCVHIRTYVQYTHPFVVYESYYSYILIFRHACINTYMRTYLHFWWTQWHNAKGFIVMVGLSSAILEGVTLGEGAPTSPVFFSVCSMSCGLQWIQTCWSENVVNDLTDLWGRFMNVYYTIHLWSYRGYSG